MLGLRDVGTRGRKDVGTLGLENVGLGRLELGEAPALEDVINNT